MEGIKSNLVVQNKYWKVLIILAFGLTLIAWLVNTPPGLLGKADAIGYAVCHRIDLRSFHLGDRQIPLCARCSGMYLGAMLGLAYQWIIGRRRTGIPSWKIIVPTSIFVIAFILDGGNSFLSLFPGAPQIYQPNNILRLLTGTGMGLAVAILLYPAFNASVWRLIDPRPAMTSFRSFVILIVIAIGLDLLVLLENPVILYPLSLISAAGVVVLLTLVYTMMLMMIFKAENRYNQFSHMIYAVIGGLTVALIQIGMLDFVRYLFTGTWDGFHL
jgi:uncharacterized membrane protein